MDMYCYAEDVTGRISRQRELRTPRSALVLRIPLLYVLSPLALRSHHPIHPSLYPAPLTTPYQPLRMPFVLSFTLWLRTHSDMHQPANRQRLLF